MDKDKLIKKFKNYGVDKLSEDTGVSRSNIYSIVRGEVNPRISTLEKLLEPLNLCIAIQSNLENISALQRDEVFAKTIYKNLAYYGAPLSSDESGEELNLFPITKVLSHALLLGRRDSTINSILPYFIYINWESIEWEEVILDSEIKRYLGYLINVIFFITNDINVLGLLSKLVNEVEFKRKEKLIKRKNLVGPILNKMFEATENKVADTWMFLTTDALADLEKRFQKWAGSADGI